MYNLKDDSLLGLTWKLSGILCIAYLILALIEINSEALIIAWLFGGVAVVAGITEAWKLKS